MDPQDFDKNQHGKRTSGVGTGIECSGNLCRDTLEFSLLIGFLDGKQLVPPLHSDHVSECFA